MQTHQDARLQQDFPFNTAVEIADCTRDLDSVWDNYVQKHPHSTYCHLVAWRRIFQETYGHKDHYLLARKGNEVLGVFPLFYMRDLTFKGNLVSMPFLDTGGVLSNGQQIEEELLFKAMSLGKSLKAATLELRYGDLPRWACNMNQTELVGPGRFYEKTYGIHYSVRQLKVRMIMTLPNDPDTLLSGFKSKLRSQIKKSMKEACEPIIGGRELIDQFYEVFAANMRDLGSPVHSKHLFANIFEALPKEARIFLVLKKDVPIAGSLTIGFRATLSNPWASSLRKYSHMNPNMLLYWMMLEYACQRGFAYFDFGRSSPNEGTYKFKEQWGAIPHKLNWIYAASSNRISKKAGNKRSSFQDAIAYWKKLPIPLTKLIGPILRKHISL
jgi:serine/alanine adding enzyme